MSTLRFLPLSLFAAALSAAPAAAQASSAAGSHFDRLYPEAASVLNAFDAGHAMLYERLFTDETSLPEEIEEEVYAEMARMIEERSIREPVSLRQAMPEFAAFAPEVVDVLDSAHRLHRQMYEIYADPGVSDKAAAVAAARARYEDGTGLALPAVPKSMRIMYDYPHSGVFREEYPQSNGLVWASHWFQLALYESLLLPREEQRAQGVETILARFRAKLSDPPASAPAEMPTAPAIAPELVRRHPEIAAVFDNLHMLHDVIADILADFHADREYDMEVALADFTNPEHLAVSEIDWIVDSLRHGIYDQGGPALGQLDRSERNIRMMGHGSHGGQGEGMSRMILPGMGGPGRSVPAPDGTREEQTGEPDPGLRSPENREGSGSPPPR